MDLIFLVALTAFIAYKLFQTLGKQNKNLKKLQHIEPVIGNLKKHVNQVQNTGFGIISLKEKNLNPNLRKVFEQLIKEEKDFTIDEFIFGVKKAFKIILTAFNNREKETLKELLEDNVYKQFIIEIDNRIKNKLTYDITLVGIKEVAIVDAHIKNSIISIVLEIESEQIIIITDQNKKVLSGESSKILPIRDVWTFKKKIKSDNLWKLTKTTSK